MPSHRIEIIDIRTDNRAHLTGKGAAWPTMAETRAHFENARQAEVPIEAAEFLLDLHDEADDLIDTIGIDAAAFEALIGEPPKSAEEYAAYDRAFWRRQLRRRAKAKTAACAS